MDIQHGGKASRSQPPDSAASGNEIAQPRSAFSSGSEEVLATEGFSSAQTTTVDRSPPPAGFGISKSKAQTTSYLGSVATDREILMRGRRAFEQGDDVAAIESFNRLISHGLQYADVHYMVGLLQERREDLDAALHSLRRAIQINPSYVEALLALASLHEQRGEFDQSQNYAERASQLSTSSSGGLDTTTRGKLANQQAALGDALAQAGEKRDAIEEYRRALDRCPTFHDVRHRLGVTLREAGLPSQAAQEFQRILRLHAHMLESQIQLGLTYYSMGRTPEAVAEWDAVLEKDPSRSEARMYLRLVRGVNRRNQPAAAAQNVLATKDGLREEINISRWSTSGLRSGPGKSPQ